MAGRVGEAFVVLGGVDDRGEGRPREVLGLRVAAPVGPVVCSPKTSGVLALDTANTYSYACTFKPDKYIGLTVLPRVTAGTRLMGMLAIGLPTGMMLAVYSYLLPGRKKPAA